MDGLSKYSSNKLKVYFKELLPTKKFYFTESKTKNLLQTKLLEAFSWKSLLLLFKQKKICLFSFSRIFSVSLKNWVRFLSPLTKGMGGKLNFRFKMFLSENWQKRETETRRCNRKLRRCFGCLWIQSWADRGAKVMKGWRKKWKWNQGFILEISINKRLTSFKRHFCWRSWREGKLSLFKFRQHNLEKPRIVYHGSGFRFCPLLINRFCSSTMTANFQ